MPKKKAALTLRPHAARMPAPSSVREVHDIPLAIRSAIHAFEVAIGGRAALIEALSTGESDDQVSAVLDILGDPANDRHALSKLCAQAGISPGQLFAAFDRATIVRARILAKLEAANAVPTVAKEVARTALPHDTICGACNGERVLHKTDRLGKPLEVPCGACNGVGTLRKDGDPDQQQKIFELTGLLRSGSAGMTISQQVLAPSFNGSSSTGTLEQLQQAVNTLLSVRPEIPIESVEGAVVDSSEK